MQSAAYRQAALGVVKAGQQETQRSAAGAAAGRTTGLWRGRQNHPPAPAPPTGVDCGDHEACCAQVQRLLHAPPVVRAFDAHQRRLACRSDGVHINIGAMEFTSMTRQQPRAAVAFVMAGVLADPVMGTYLWP